MALLTRDAILSAKDRKSETVMIEAWGGEVRLMTMSALRMEQFHQAMRDHKEAGGESVSFAAALVAFSAVDENGAPLFTFDDARSLSECDCDSIKAASGVAARLNGLAAGAKDAAAKN